MSKGIDQVVEIFEEFQKHPAVTSVYFTAHRSLVAATLTAAYFAQDRERTPVKKVAKKK